jgi:FkbM family methyltransferase
MDPLSYLKSLTRRLLFPIKPDPIDFLSGVKGVIHVGANLGQERELYAMHGLNVLWIEPIPDIYQQLQKLIASYPKQKALCRLVTDVNDREYVFHISINEGQSSSILDLAAHKQLYPNIDYTGSIRLNSARLSTLMHNEGIDLSIYDTLVIDTQGSELLVLKGAVDILPHFRFIKSEVADFEAYKGCCRLSEMDKFLRQHDFRRTIKARFGYKFGAGSYYQVVYAAPILR